MTPQDAPELVGWMLLSEVAKRTGVARQSANRWASQGRFRTLKRLGGAEKKPIFVVSVKEVERFAEAMS